MTTAEKLKKRIKTQTVNTYIQKNTTTLHKFTYDLVSRISRYLERD